MARGNIYKIYGFSIAEMFIPIIAVMVPFFKLRGLDMKDIFMTQAAFGITVAICEIPTGYLADIWGRRKAMLLGGVLRTIAFLMLPFLGNFWQIIAYEVIIGVGFSLVSGIDLALFYDEMRGESQKRQTAAMSHMFFLKNIGETISALAASALLLWSLDAVAWVTAITAVIPFLIMLTIRESAFEKMSGSHRENFRMIFRDIFRGTAILRLIFINMIVWGSATFFMVWTYQQFWADAGVPLAWFGVLWATYNFTAALSSKLAHRLTWMRGYLFYLLPALVIAGYFAMAFNVNWLGVACGLLFYMSRGFSMVVLGDLYNSHLPSRYRATANSITSLGLRLSFVVFGPLIGWAIDHKGFQMTLSTMGAIFGILALVFMIPLAREHRLGHAK